MSQSRLIRFDTKGFVSKQMIYPGITPYTPNISGVFAFVEFVSSWALTGIATDISKKNVIILEDNVKVWCRNQVFDDQTREAHSDMFEEGQEKIHRLGFSLQPLYKVKERAFQTYTGEKLIYSDELEHPLYTACEVIIPEAVINKLIKEEEE